VVDIEVAAVVDIEVMLPPLELEEVKDVEDVEELDDETLIAPT
jgi:hypothetical protein